MSALQSIQYHEKENEKVYNATHTSNYRKYDDEFIHTKAYAHIAGKIKELSSSFNRPISVLDVGCGTGRYFHAIHNLEALTGIDVSHNMLEEAKNPYGRTAIAISDIELIEGNFYNYDFGNRKFDFIYSVGVLGEHAPFDEHTCHKLKSLLKDGGKLFFTNVDIEPRKNAKRKLAETIYPLLPKNIKAVLDKRWETCYMTWTQLENIVRKEQFSSYEISRYASEDPKWDGVHLECVAIK